MKFTRRPWGLFAYGFNHRTGKRTVRLVSTHKTSWAARGRLGPRFSETVRRLTKAERNPQ